MKTFDQFLIEAQRPQFASQRDIAGAEKFLSGAHGTIRRSAKRTSREEAERAQRLANLPAGTGTQSEWLKADIARQLRQQRTPQPPTSTTPAKPKIELGLTKLSSTKPKYIIDIRGLSRRAREKAGVVIKGKTGKPLTGAARKSRIRSARTFSRKPV